MINGRRAKARPLQSVTVARRVSRNALPPPPSTHPHSPIPFLRRALVDDGARRPSHRLPLALRFPAVDPHIFGIRVGWLYTRTNDPFHERNPTPTPRKREQNKKPAYDADLDSAASQLCLPLLSFPPSLSGSTSRDVAFCNAIVDDLAACIEGTQTLPRVPVIEHLWSLIEPDMTLARLRVDYAAFNMDGAAFARAGREYLADFVLGSQLLGSDIDV